MRITITTDGSRGDVRPFALGLGLKEAGHEILLAAPATFEGLVREHGLGVYPISLDPLEGFRRQLEKGDASLFEFAWSSRGILTPVLRKDLQAYMEACQRPKPSSTPRWVFLVTGSRGAAVEAFHPNVARV